MRVTYKRKGVEPQVGKLLPQADGGEYGQVGEKGHSAGMEA